MATTGSLTVARPSLIVAGQQNSGLADGLQSLSIVENVSGLYRCEATFVNWGNASNSAGFLYFDRSTLDFGKVFQVKLDSEVIFDGRITGLEGNFPAESIPEITVLAEDRFQDLRMTRRTRTFNNLSDSDVISRIAGEYSLTPSVSLNGPSYKVLAQINQSDLAFLRERVRSVDGEIWMAGNTLNAKAHSDRNEGTLTLTYKVNLNEFSVLADLSSQRTSVSVNGWDVASKAALHYEATDSTVQNELNGGKSGASLLNSTLGQRKEALAHTVPLTSQEAQSAAEAYFKMNARRFIVGHGIAEADSRLRVGHYLDLKGLGPLFSGKYYLAEVRHLFDIVHGIRTEFTAERPGLGQN